MSNEVLRYRGYDTVIHYDVDDKILYGKIEGIGDAVGFHSETVEDIETEFHEAVDDYIAFCEQVGKEPEKPFKGSFNVRIEPDDHRALFIEATQGGMKMNDIVRHAIHQYIHHNEQNVQATIVLRVQGEDARTIPYETSTGPGYAFEPFQIVKGGLM